MYLSINWSGFWVISTYQFEKLCASFPIQIAGSELNTARFYTTDRNVLLREMFWTASTIWAQKHERLVYYTHCTKLWTEYNLDLLSGTVRWQAGVTLTEGHSTEDFLYSDPNKKNVHSTTLQQCSLYRPWPMCFSKDIFWRIVMYTSRHVWCLQTNIAWIYKRVLPIQESSSDNRLLTT